MRALIQWQWERCVPSIRPLSSPAAFLLSRGTPEGHNRAMRFHPVPSLDLFCREAVRVPIWFGRWVLTAVCGLNLALPSDFRAALNALQ